MSGTLYLIATPIGNLEDLTPRARRLLHEVPHLYAEDTRTVRRLFRGGGRSGSPARSLFEGNEEPRSEEVVAHLVAGEDVALVSEAGTPTVSDPGYRAVRAALTLGAAVVAVPGPSAVLAALVSSGLATAAFRFGGFLPREPGARRRVLTAVREDRATQVFFESPRRIVAALADVVTVLGDRSVAVCRELTKVHETVYRGIASQVAGALGSVVRGEVTLVIAGAPEHAPAATAAELEAAVREALGAGATVRDAARQAAGVTGASRREAYRIALRIQDEGAGD